GASRPDVGWGIRRGRGTEQHRSTGRRGSDRKGGQKVARASYWAGVGIIAGLALGGAALQAASFGTAGLATALGQASSRSTRVASSAVSSGIDCYLRGEYEQAGAYFQQAQNGRDAL